MLTCQPISSFGINLEAMMVKVSVIKIILKIYI